MRAAMQEAPQQSAAVELALVVAVHESGADEMEEVPWDELGIVIRGVMSRGEAESTLTRLLTRPLGTPESAGLNDRVEALREELAKEALATRGSSDSVDLTA